MHYVAFWVKNQLFFTTCNHGNRRLSKKMPVTLGLDVQQITIATGSHGTGLTKPALDQHWMENVEFLRYEPPPLDPMDVASLEEWTERTKYIEDDLRWLLKLPHHKFWSQVVYDESLQRCLDSYLKNAPRSYDPVTFDPVTSLPDDLKAKQKNLHKFVFMTFLRMATHKESKESFISPTAFGEIIYEHFLFDVVKLMELCVLYGGGNAELLGKMIANIFNNQPKYNEDLIQVVPTILQIFENILEKCGLKTEPASLQQVTTSRVLHTIPDNELGDIIHYITDSALTILGFLEIYPNGAFAFHKHNFVLEVAAFYETVIPTIEQALKERRWETASKEKSFRRHLRLGKVGLAKVCQSIVATCHIQPVVESKSQDEAPKLVEDYLELMSSLLSDKNFLSIFAQHYNVGEDLDVVLQKSHVDETRAQFILDGFRSVLVTSAGVKNKRGSKSSLEGGTGGDESREMGTLVGVHHGMVPEDYQTDEYIEQLAPSSSEGACGGDISEVEMASLISSIKELFEDYGEGFIEACLEEYAFDSAKVINAILEDKLVPGLQELDRKMPRTAKPAAASMPKESVAAPAAASLLLQRSNIYQNDEFDVFSRDKVDTSRIHKGKKSDKVDEQKFLNDKSQLADIRSTYEDYNYEYEDEYDDTYDANDVGAGDADSADELTSRRRFMVPRVLRGARGESSSGEEDDEELDNAESERQTTNRQQLVLDKGGGQGRSRETNLRGHAKGKGQSQETQRARGYKEKTKGSRVNHNRKAMADRKRKKGMGPLS